MIFLPFHLPDIPKRREYEVNVLHTIIRFSVKVVLTFGTDIRFPSFLGGNINIQVPISSLVDRPIPTVTPLEDQKYLVTGVREITHANCILQLSSQIAVDAASVLRQQFPGLVVPHRPIGNRRGPANRRASHRLNANYLCAAMFTSHGRLSLNLLRGSTYPERSHG